ncbi:hypothetical protein J6590_017744 [Homalodisca vitripennis]|nr:hypothetical protein J6590_017744 [Homalodisca vitripennis]
MSHSFPRLEVPTADVASAQSCFSGSWPRFLLSQGLSAGSSLYFKVKISSPPQTVTLLERYHCSMPFSGIDSVTSVGNCRLDGKVSQRPRGQTIVLEYVGQSTPPPFWLLRSIISETARPCGHPAARTEGHGNVCVHACVATHRHADAGLGPSPVVGANYLHLASAFGYFRWTQRVLRERSMQITKATSSSEYGLAFVTFVSNLIL